LLLLFKVASQLEVLPGAEFRVAFEEAMSYGGKVLLGDRPVQVSNPAMEAGYVLMKLRIYIINF
jgi:pheromone shutdown protein TraB